MPTYDDMHNSIHDADQKFKLHFKTNARQFMDPLLTGLRRKFDIDIIKLDDWLHRQGYIEEEHGSARDYIVLKYGDLAAKFINNLIGHKRIIKRRKKKRTIKRRGEIK